MIIMFKILYDGENPFENLAPTPMVSRKVNSVHYGAKHGEIESFTFDGYITGDCEWDNTFSGFWGRANELIDRFCHQFKKLEIVEHIEEGNSGNVFQAGYAMVKNITFDDSPFASYLPFTMQVDIFPETSFSSYGIWEPRKEISFQQNDDGTVSVSKNVSARGFNTSKPALQNAEEFVSLHTGWSEDFAPLFVPYGYTPILLSQNSQIDRTTATYSVAEDYIYQYCDNQDLTNCFLKYTVDINDGDDGVILTINGEIKGGVNTTLANFRDSYAAIDFLAIAEAAYPIASFYDSPSSKSIKEDIDSKITSFSLTFADHIIEDPYIVDSFSISHSTADNKTCATANIEIKSNIGCIAERWEKINDYKNNFNLRSWIAQKWAEYEIAGEPKGSFTSLTSGLNQKAISITLGGTLCDKKIDIPELFEDIEYNVQITPAMPKFVPFYGLDCLGAVTVQKLGGLSRRSVSISGTATLLHCSDYEAAKVNLLDYINLVIPNYLNEDDAFLTKYSVNKGSIDNERVVSFNFSWSEVGQQVLPDALVHSTIS